MGKRKVREVPKEDALEMPESEMIALLQSSVKALNELLNTTEFLYDKRMKVILGAMSDDDTPKVRTLFNAQGRIPVMDIPLESKLNFYSRKCTNDASNSGNQSIKLEPAADSIVIIHQVSQLNGDVAARVLNLDLYTAGAAWVSRLYTRSTAAGNTGSYPYASDSPAYPVKDPIVLTDALELVMSAVAIAVSQDSNFYILYEVVGDAPTITETGPTDCVWSDVA